MSQCAPATVVDAIHASGRMQQLVPNLLGNALTHGAEEVPVAARTATEASNSGDPIPGHMLPKVIELYWRPPSSQPGRSFGLGLYICKQIVEAHGGTLEVGSTVPEGTCFTDRIPLSQQS